MKTKIFVGLGVAAIVIVIGIYLFFARGMTQDENWLIVKNVDVSNDTVVIHALNPNSGQMISGYSCYVENETAYVKFRGTLVNKLGHSINENNIIIHGDFTDINQVVLLGKGDQSKIIWNK